MDDLHVRDSATDVGRVVEQTRAALDAWVAKAGYVEVELVVGEEPEEGIEVEVTPVQGELPPWWDRPSFPHPGLW